MEHSFGPNHLRAVWRLSLGLGIIPALAVLIWRLNMEEPERFKRDSMRDAKIPYWLIIKRYWVGLLAISTSWFLYDFIVYPVCFAHPLSSQPCLGTDLVRSSVCTPPPLSTTLPVGVTLFPSSSPGASLLSEYCLPPFILLSGHAGLLTTSLTSAFYIPGTVIGAFVVDYFGPKNTMIFGLVAQSIVGFIMSGLYARLTDHIGAFAVVYGIFLSLGEVGPGNNLGLLASKSGPTAVRGQYYGIAAAVGKVGAFVGTWAFPPIIEAFGGADTTRGNTGPFWIGSALALLSALITLLFVRPLTTDGMAKEDEEFRAYLEANGYDVSQMGLRSEATTMVDDVASEKEEGSV